MAKNYVQPGNVMDVVVGAKTDAGDVVVVGDIVGVALSDIANGATGPVQVSGVFELPKAASQAISQGVTVYWNGSAITTTASTNDPAGVAWRAAGSSDATVQVALNVRTTLTVTVTSGGGGS